MRITYNLFILLFAVSTAAAQASAECISLSKDHSSTVSLCEGKLAYTLNAQGIATVATVERVFQDKVKLSIAQEGGDVEIWHKTNLDEISPEVPCVLDICSNPDKHVFITNNLNEDREGVVLNAFANGKVYTSYEDNGTIKAFFDAAKVSNTVASAQGFVADRTVLFKNDSNQARFGILKSLTEKRARIQYYANGWNTAYRDLSELIKDVKCYKGIARGDDVHFTNSQGEDREGNIRLIFANGQTLVHYTHGTGIDVWRTRKDVTGHDDHANCDVVDEDSGDVNKHTLPLSGIYPTRLATGEAHSCAVSTNGVVCSGSNSEGQTDPDFLGSIKGSRILAAGAHHTCAVTGEGVLCTGDNKFGQSGRHPELKDARQLVAGWYHTCALTSDKDTPIKCWGDNRYHQIEVPPGLKNPRELAAGWFHTCAVTDDGVKCWGDNKHQQLDPKQVLRNPRSISASWLYTCAVTDDGVKCWGDKKYVLLTPSVTLKNPRMLASGWMHACAVTDDGIVCWGVDRTHRFDNKYHQLSNIPQNVRKIEQIVAGWRHTCVLGADGVICWGDNSQKQTDIQVGYQNLTKVALGAHHICAMTPNAISCLGENLQGQTDIRPDLQEVTDIASGANHSCAIDKNAGKVSVKCWGDNSFGQSEDHSELKNPRQVVAGVAHTCALTDDGVQCWGANHFSERQVNKNLTQASQIFAGDSFTCGLQSQQVFCWGADDEHQSETNFQVNDPWTVVQGTAGSAHACILTVDPSGNNDISCWGRNGSGQTDKPKDLPTHILQLVASGNHTCALSAQGVQCWGDTKYVHKLTTGLKNAKKIFAYGENICALTDNGTQCWGKDSFSKNALLKEF